MAPLGREVTAALARQASDPGVQCGSVQGTLFRCSRDRYHPGAHVCRPTKPGERGMVGWGQTRDEAIAALAEATR